MPMENREDRNPTLADDKIDQIGKAMHDRHPNVIEHHGKPEWLLFDRGIGHSDFICELVPETNASSLVPGECFRDVGFGRFPDELARHYAPRVLSS